MKLHLSDGTSWSGQAFGAHRDVQGEVVFNTGMTGYVETLTDPSYRGQILVLTYPLQGNYGVPEDRFESSRIQVQGLVVTHYSWRPSHHASVRSLGDWLASQGIPAVTGIDTRSLTRRLREHGTMQGHLLASDRLVHEAKLRADSVDPSGIVEFGASSLIQRYPGGNLRILVIDTGAKESIIRCLQARDASIVRVPHHSSWEPFLDEVDGVLLTNGPGDPSDYGKLVDRIRHVLHRQIPVMGICLGHQLLALAAGATTYKLKYGHRSQNQPVLDLTTGRAYITSQNHGYAVDEASLPDDWAPWFVNLNDGTSEGLRHRFKPFMSVQFHPEAAAGPRDTAFLFDDFLRMVALVRHDRLVLPGALALSS